MRGIKSKLIGQRFGRLVVVAETESDRCKDVYWLCKCDCGNETVVGGHCLRNHSTHSCGCLKREGTHRMSGTRLYNTWSHMKQRCSNVNNKAYQNYGGRGIKVCDEWKKDFQAFHDFAISNGYQEDLTIERINNDDGYYPGNVRFIPLGEQNRNQRRCRTVYKGGVNNAIR